MVLYSLLASAIAAKIFAIAVLKEKMGLAVAFLMEVMPKLGGITGVHLRFEGVEPCKNGQQIGRIRFLLPGHGVKVFVQRAGEAAE